LDKKGEKTMVIMWHCQEGAEKIVLDKKGGRTIVLDKKGEKTMVCDIVKKELKK
jgi:hypothetical protein